MCDRSGLPRTDHKPQGGDQEEQEHDGGAPDHADEEVQHGAA